MSYSHHSAPSARTLIKGAVSAVGVAAPLIIASAQEGSALKMPTPVAVIVRVPAPWYAPRFLIERKMRATIPQYENIAGLGYKAYTFEQSTRSYGGVYLWTDRAAATDWFNPAWFERVRKERGAEADVQFFDVLVAIDNTPQGDTESTDFAGVATLVTVPHPARNSREELVDAIKAVLPIYQKIDGLMRKYFITTSDGKFGGIYFWRDRSAAEAWFTNKWQESAHIEYGADPVVVWFSAPILAATRLPDSRVGVTRP